MRISYSFGKCKAKDLRKRLKQEWFFIQLQKMTIQGVHILETPDEDSQELQVL